MSNMKAWQPASGGRILVPGTSDQKNIGVRAKSPEPKLTTYERTAAAVKQYWDDRATGVTGSAARTGGTLHTTGARFEDTVPGGEKDVATRVRESCWHDNVYLKQQEERVIPSWPGTPLDTEEKERVRTRGVQGYTGVQPPPQLARPPPPREQQEDISKLTSINGLDAPRPRVKGIAGYTGHQPPAPDKRPAPPQPRQTLQQRFGNRPHPAVALGLTAYHNDPQQQQQAQQQEQQQQEEEGEADEWDGTRYFDDGVELDAAQTPDPWIRQQRQQQQQAPATPPQRPQGPAAAAPGVAGGYQRPLAAAAAGGGVCGGRYHTAASAAQQQPRQQLQQQERPGSSRPTMYEMAYGGSSPGSRQGTAGCAGASPFARAQTAGGGRGLRTLPLLGADGKPTYVMAKYAAYGGVRNNFDSLKL